MGASWNLPVIAAGFAAASHDQSQWATALDRLVDSIGATGAIMIPFETGDRPLGVTGTAGVAELMDAYIREGWYKHDYRARSIPKLRATGIAVDQDLISLEDMRRSFFYNDFLGRLGFEWFAGVAFGAGEDSWCLTIQRTSKQGPFTTAEQKRLAALRGPITVAATIAQELGLAHARGMADAFDTTSTAACPSSSIVWAV